MFSNEETLFTKREKRSARKSKKDLRQKEQGQINILQGKIVHLWLIKEERLVETAIEEKWKKLKRDQRFRDSVLGIMGIKRDIKGKEVRVNTQVSR